VRRSSRPPKPAAPELRLDANFVALDFETANPSPDSACAIGLVSCLGGRIIDRQHFFLRPPTPLFTFSWCHGITWEQVKDKPTFAQVWPQIQRTLDEAEFVAAHNASFDRKVLGACCASIGVAARERQWVCTVRLARATWNLRPTKLSDCASFLKIDLNHHEALSDAEACARIVLAASQAPRKQEKEIPA
jgi:DNA polymerase-3 subunit epsilon